MEIGKIGSYAFLSICLFQPEDLNVLFFVSRTRHSRPGRDSMKLVPFSGSMIKTVVERASASMAVFDTIDTLVSVLAASPVEGFTI